MKKIAITQSNYIPWRGFFDLIKYTDEFIFFDEAQYTRRDWRNRNKILYNDKVKWLTIPLKNKGNFFQKISNMNTLDDHWKQDHLNKIESYYRKTKNFKNNFNFVKKIYKNCSAKTLSEINKYFIVEICKILEIKNQFFDSQAVLPIKKNIIF